MLWLTPLVAIAALVVSLYGTIKKDSSSSWQEQRAQLLKQLKQQDGKHLIIVSYGPGHSVHNEWVYNEADIDGAKVVWARDMDVAQNCNLVAYFRNRRTWSLEADGDQSVPKLKPFPTKLCK